MDQALVNHARRTDMAATIVALGGVRDRYDPHKYRLAGVVLSITGKQFYIHTRGQGGAGPISLVMQLTGRSFPKSVTYLVGLGGQRPTADPPPSPSAQDATDSGAQAHASFTPPVRDEGAWPRVRAYLTTERALPSAFINDLHGRGLIYADHRANAVFLRRGDDDHVTGASLRGTVPGRRFQGLVDGTQRDDGYFRVPVGTRRPDRIPTLVLVESPIDALSYRALHDGRVAGLVISTDGAGDLPTRLIDRALTSGWRVWCAFDRDQGGDTLWRHVQERYPEQTASEQPTIERRLPHGKDWNDDLREASRRVHHRHSGGPYDSIL